MSGGDIGNMESKFENIKLILTNDGKEYYLESYDELINLIFGEDYNRKIFNEKYITRFEKAHLIVTEHELDLVDTRVGKLTEDGKIESDKFNFSNSFIIDNDKTFILSLLKVKNMVLLEKKNENIFYIEGIIEDLEKSNIIGINEYVVINKLVDKLLLLNMKLKD